METSVLTCIQVFGLHIFYVVKADKSSYANSDKFNSETEDKRQIIWQIAWEEAGCYVKIYECMNFASYNTIVKLSKYTPFSNSRMRLFHI